MSVISCLAVENFAALGNNAVNDDSVCAGLGVVCIGESAFDVSLKLCCCFKFCMAEITSELSGSCKCYTAS